MNIIDRIYDLININYSYMGSIRLMWLLLIIITLTMEGFTLGLVTIWFTCGALVGLIANYLGASLCLQIVLFMIVTVICLFFTRPIAVKYLNIGKYKSNVEGIIDKKARVTSKIDNINGLGKAVVNGQEWTARSVDDNITIDEGQIVTIIKIEGVKLIVK